MRPLRRNVESLAPHWQALLLGGVVLLLALLLFFALYKILGIEAKDWTSFAQAYTGFVAIFVGTALGAYAVREYAESHAKPSLKLIVTTSEMQGQEGALDKF